MGTLLHRSHRRLAGLAATALVAIAALGAPAACGDSGTRGGEVETLRTPGAERPGASGSDAGPLRVRRDIPYAGADGPALDVYRPAGAGRGRQPAVLVLHGGSWRFGDKRDVEPTAVALAEAGFLAFAVGYTLVSGERAGFPRQARELRAAIRFVRRNAGRFGVDPSRIGALGISAGAHLAALVGANGRGRRDRGGRLGAVVAWSGPFDLRAQRLRRVLGFEIADFLGCGDCPRRAALASPISHVSRDDPPILIVNSTRELIPASQARWMARRVRRAGGRARLLMVPGALHAPLFEPMVIEPTIAFLRRQLR